MTDTQFQVGRIYATRVGGTVLYTGIGRDAVYCMVGQHKSGSRKGVFDAWDINGRFVGSGVEHPYDLLPLPEPAAQDEREELLAALREIARQKLSGELAVEDYEGADFEHAHDVMINIARAAIAKAERT